MVSAEAQSRAKRKKTESFEEAMKRLEEIVDKLEKGDLPLEEAMEAFTEGVGLVRQCHEKLEEAEKKVQMLVQGEDGRWIATPFDKPSENNEP
ncbi:MAG: exodeoxyribonuclease VII small subunit [Desulfosoma sp.]|uniref:exodeoxyribonuclease VII small subunit n=1 Tax=Desulfosoma sp. TaxID=2603217 RepID=UPI004049F47A